jgi:hypothetical protein
VVQSEGEYPPPMYVLKRLSYRFEVYGPSMDTLKREAVAGIRSVSGDAHVEYDIDVEPLLENGEGHVVTWHGTVRVEIPGIDRRFV